MKALILAAGLGTRLAPITHDIPKSLVPVNGKPILIKQIDNLVENGISPQDITIVSGYKADILEEKVHEMFPEISIIKNEKFDVTNNMYSAFLGRNMVQGNSFLMMNADVFYDASIIKELLENEQDNLIATDVGNYLDESMKVVENNGRLVKISKDISEEEALGASIDVYKFSKNGGEMFFKKCQEYIENRKETNMWSEVALNDILNDVLFAACPITGKWVEIDNHEDLSLAESLFKNT